MGRSPRGRPELQEEAHPSKQARGCLIGEPQVTGVQLRVTFLPPQSVSQGPWVTEPPTRSHPTSTGGLRESLGEGWCEHRERSWEPPGFLSGPWRGCSRSHPGLALRSRNLADCTGAPYETLEGHVFYDLGEGGCSVQA